MLDSVLEKMTLTLVRGSQELFGWFVGWLNGEYLVKSFVQRWVLVTFSQKQERKSGVWVCVGGGEGGEEGTWAGREGMYLA